MKGRIFKAVVSVVLSLSMVILAGGPAMASDGAATSAASVTSAAVAANLLPRLQAYVHVTTSGITLDRAGALRAGLPTAIVNQVAADYAKINTSLTKDKFNWAGVRTASARVELVKENAPPAGAITAGQVVIPNATVRGNYWSWRITFDEWETTLIIKSMVLAAGTLGFYALLAALPGVTLPAAAVVALAGGLVALGAGYIDVVDWLGHSKGVFVAGHMAVFAYVWHN